MKIFTISMMLFLSSAIFAQNFNWTSQNSGVTEMLNDVFFANSQTGWAVGNSGTILNTTNGGQTWSTQTSSATQEIRAVFFIDASTGWAVGGSTIRTMLKTTDGGATWIDLPANSITSNQMFDIAFFDVNIGWVVTYDSIYRTVDGGNTWVNETYTNTVSSPRNRAISVTSDTTAYVGGSRITGVGTRGADVFYRNLSNSPINWDISAINTFVNNDEFHSIEFSNSHVGFAGGTKGNLLRKTGTLPTDNWNLNFEIGEDLTIRAISFSNENNGMFCASKTIASINYTLVYHTIDNGDNWSASPDSIPNLLLGVVHAPDTINAWAVGANGSIFKGTRSSVGINEIGLNLDVNIYPNPSSNVFNISINSQNKELINYTLTDISGRIIEKGNRNLGGSTSIFTVNVSEYNSGVYFLNLRTEEGEGTFRLLKK